MQQIKHYGSTVTGAREPWRRWSLCSPNFICAHPTFGTTKFFWQTNQQKFFFANKSTDNSTSVQHLYCCLLICLQKKLLYSICICIAVVHFKNVHFKKFRPNCVLIQFAQSSDIRTVVQQQHNTN